MTPAETLRAAALMVRETAAQATPGEREVAYLAGIGQCVRTADFSFCVTVERGMEGDAAWIALASPALAPTIVAWLEAAERHASKVSDPRNQEAVADPHALAYARLVTGQDPA